MRYTIIINENDNKTYTASVPELPCEEKVTGKDINEAIAKIKEKIKVKIKTTELQTLSRQREKLDYSKNYPESIKQSPFNPRLAVFTN